MWTLTIGETMPRSFTVKWKALIFVITSLQMFVESILQIKVQAATLWRISCCKGTSLQLR